MSFDAERQAIESRFAANFTSLAADRIAYENVKFKQPTSGSWVRLTIRNGDARQASIANSPLNRYIGVIVVDVFVPEDTGTATARQLAESAAAVFRNVQFSVTGSGTITTRVPTIFPVGVQNGWLQLSMSVAFYRDIVD